MWNELFAVPFATGLALAVVLPALGCYLRLRDEWLAALAYSHVAAAGALLAMVAGLPALPGGVVAAGLAGVVKRPCARRLAGSAGFAIMLLGGWAASVLMTANFPMAERLGHALFDGQLYFADASLLSLVLAGGAFALVALGRLSRHLLLAHAYPDFYRLRGLRSWPIHGGFDLLAALMLALATLSLGVMGAFALVFIPPWLAFRRAQNWRSGLIVAVTAGAVAYSAAFVAALSLDQPFAPVLALMLLVVGLFIA